MPNSIFDADFVQILPQALSGDPKMVALATALEKELKATTNDIKNAAIYARIDEIPEALLDVLAYDFHCDWYDVSYPIEIKRALLKNNIRMHKHLGTKYAVETALQDVYSSAFVEEWFQYAGRPYTFRVNVAIGNTGIKEDEIFQMIRRMWYYKNLRSHCEHIIFRMNAPRATIRAAPFLVFGEVLKIKGKPDSELYSKGFETTAIGTRYVESMKIKGKIERKLQSEGAETAAIGTRYLEFMKIKGNKVNILNSDINAKTMASATVGQSLVIKTQI